MLKGGFWGSGGFFVFLVLNRFVFFIVAIPAGGFFTALAFVRVNDTPLISYVSYGLAYILNPKKYIFRKGVEQDLQEIIISEENK